MQLWKAHPLLLKDGASIACAYLLADGLAAFSSEGAQVEWCVAVIFLFFGWLLLDHFLLSAATTK